MNERDELARTLYVADSTVAEAVASREWEYLRDNTHQASTRVLAKYYQAAKAILAAGYSKPRTITTATELEAALQSAGYGRDGDIK